MGGRRFPTGTDIPVNGVIDDLAVDNLGRLMISDVTSSGIAIENGVAVPVRNAANADNHAGIADTTGGTLVVRLSALTMAMVDNGDALVIPVTGVYATTATFIVVGGMVTGITLS